MEEAFLAELNARYGIDTSDPHALAELDAEERSAFFLEFYDSLMGFTGADRVDHWMPAIGWTPALAQRVGRSVRGHRWRRGLQSTLQNARSERLGKQHQPVS